MYVSAKGTDEMCVPREAQIHTLPVFPGVSESKAGVWQPTTGAGGKKERSKTGGAGGGAFNTDVGKDFILCVVIRGRTSCPSVRRAAN